MGVCSTALQRDLTYVISATESGMISTNTQRAGLLNHKISVIPQGGNDSVVGRVCTPAPREAAPMSSRSACLDNSWYE